MVDDADELEVPPMVACSRCGRPDCNGCSPGSEAPASGGLPWEATGAPGALRRMFRTAELSAIDPERVFGAMDGGRLWPALSFAVACEGLALLSLGLVGVAASLLVAPRLTWSWLTSASAWWLFLGLVWLAHTLLMAVHLLWGFCLEAGAGWAGTPPDHRRGFRFGMYSTGWDLLTSPAGIGLSLVFRGGSDFAPPILQAMRVARRAVDAYLDDCRKLEPRARRAAWLLTAGAFGAALLLLLALAAWATLVWIRSELG